MWVYYPTGRSSGLRRASKGCLTFVWPWIDCIHKWSLLVFHHSLRSVLIAFPSFSFHLNMAEESWANLERILIRSLSLQLFDLAHSRAAERNGHLLWGCCPLMVKVGSAFFLLLQKHWLQFLWHICPEINCCWLHNRSEPNSVNSIPSLLTRLSTNNVCGYFYKNIYYPAEWEA